MGDEPPLETEMTNAEIEAAKAAFLAKGGKIEVVAPEAGGVRSAREWAEFERTHHQGRPVGGVSSERAAEQRMEHVREAYHTGGRAAAIRELNDLHGGY